MGNVERRRIGVVIYDGHVRARTLPDDPALDDLRTAWGEVEYVPADFHRGAVDAFERIMDSDSAAHSRVLAAEGLRALRALRGGPSTRSGGQ